MRDFGTPAGRLRILPTSGKLLYTAFALSALVGLLLSWRLYGVAVGERGEAVYYGGAPVSAEPGADVSSGDAGPALELPDEVTRSRVIVEPISDRKLLEVTHFHLFSMPVYVLVLGHIWLLARLPSWLQAAGVASSIVVTALHLAAPWLVRGSPAMARLVPISGVAMLVVLGIVALVPAVDMWLPNKRPMG